MNSAKVDVVTNAGSGALKKAQQIFRGVKMRTMSWSWFVKIRYGGVNET